MSCPGHTIIRQITQEGLQEKTRPRVELPSSGTHSVHRKIEKLKVGHLREGDKNEVQGADRMGDAPGLTTLRMRHGRSCLPGPGVLGRKGRAVHCSIQGDAGLASLPSPGVPTGPGREEWDWDMDTAVLAQLTELWTSAATATSSRLPVSLRCCWAVSPFRPCPPLLSESSLSRGRTFPLCQPLSGLRGSQGAREGCHDSVFSTGHLPGVPGSGE